MHLDPIVVDLLKTFVGPILMTITASLAWGAQVRSRKAHPMLYATIGELVKTGTFKAENLINIGVLRPEPEPDFDPIELIKILRGG